MDKNSEEYRKMIEARSTAFLSYVGSCIEKEFVEEFDSIEKEMADVKIPEELEQRLRSVIRDFEKKDHTRKRNLLLKRTAKICACILLALVLVGTALVYNVDAIRLRIFDLLFHEEPEYIEITPIEVNSGESAEIPKDWNPLWYPEYLPEGYILNSTSEFGRTKTFVFTDESGKMIRLDQISIRDNGTSIQVDNEAEESGDILIHDNQGHWWSRYGTTSLLWQQNGMVFTLSGELELNEIIKVAESIVYLERNP
ncbi:DUF4367 domain-containing protein [Sinanaerobacter chloroacetimidivorans]|uniref:DUF4367 domain-containing protein n=1 Tax=Sinanaerobacter chloroacetimidivorans TaxID=2818044 RepID=A0A8J8B234_9FIRM|nr:DUF4367 domain-containing protein [Sinanaerobacter chloroacetimidivorans]MBR0598331.1 DUF4367 domain-containing protein [Sinanaerobacter chloroacetimidivorans]